MEDFRSGIQKMIQIAWQLYNPISGGQRFADKLPVDFKDNLTNVTYGYSFLSHGPFSTTPQGLLMHLVHGWSLVSLDGGGCLGWTNQPYSASWMSNELNNILSILTFILPGLSTQVMEFVDHKLWSASWCWCLYMIIGEMFLLSWHHKMTNIMELDIWVPVFYPKPQQDLTLKIFAGGLWDCKPALPLLWSTRRPLNFTEHQFGQISLELCNMSDNISVLLYQQLYVGSKWDVSLLNTSVINLRLQWPPYKWDLININ